MGTGIAVRARPTSSTGLPNPRNTARCLFASSGSAIASNETEKTSRGHPTSGKYANSSYLAQCHRIARRQRKQEIGSYNSQESNPPLHKEAKKQIHRDNTITADDRKSVGSNAKECIK
ncbi:hypothetical protein Nepgr_011541 [Nepenthes gracilis]|uniref:Uncharacterized protein n=1 Tax=Nepenthes gracilis TaxID=150966 RepID=A0AAD3SFC0_NEPGR|nr:hypothetical protein Nepgr_011541 [Nepenthes gracilis]